MNIELTSLTAWFTAFKRPAPARDWALIAGVAALVALSGVGFAGYLFWSTQTGSIVAASQEVLRAPIPVSRDAIKKVLENYEARATNYVGQNFIVVDVIDPHPPTKR